MLESGDVLFVDQLMINRGDGVLPQLLLLQIRDRFAQSVEATLGFLRLWAMTVDAVSRKKLLGQVGVGYSAEGKQHRHAHRGKCRLDHAMSVS